MNVVLIPGNPPASYFYKLWKSELEESGRFSSVSYLGFPKIEGHKNSEHFFELMVEHYSEKLQGIDDLVIIAHSIGSTIASELLKTKTVQAKRCFYLFPFFGVPTAKGQMIIHALHAKNRIFGEKKIIRYRHLLEKLVPEAKDLTDEEIKVALSLIEHERSIVMRKTQVSWDQDTPQLCFYADNDQWYSETIHQQINESMKTQKVEAKHDFVVDRDQRQLLTTKIINQIDKGISYEKTVITSPYNISEFMR